ncbi:MAG: hypothetical protein RLZZ519_2758 [Bacteroidota bacterium]
MSRFEPVCHTFWLFSFPRKPIHSNFTKRPHLKNPDIPPNLVPMNPLTPIKQNLLLLGILLGLSSCAPKPAIFRAFSDGTMSWWSLNLYADSSFDMHLGGGDFEGHYRLLGDTILLRYPEAQPDAVGPAAFWIDRRGGVIRSMRRDDTGWVLDSGAWMRVVEDGLE